MRSTSTFLARSRHRSLSRPATVALFVLVVLFASSGCRRFAAHSAAPGEPDHGANLDRAALDLAGDGLSNKDRSTPDEASPIPDEGPPKKDQEPTGKEAGVTCSSWVCGFVPKGCAATCQAYSIVCKVFLCACWKNGTLVGTCSKKAGACNGCASSETVADCCYM